MNNKKWFISSALVCSLLASGAQGAVAANEAGRLGSDLTPFGAERQGNASGTIPAWTGGYADQPQGYGGSGQHHIDPFPDDQPLFTIDRKNREVYQERLSEGSASLIETYPTTFNMKVYESRRTHTTPQVVQDNTRANASQAKLVAKGSGIENAYGGVPFPILSGSNEEMAQQAIWNHLTRWRGEFVTRRSSEVAVQTNGSYSLVTSQQEAYFNFYNPEADANSLENTLFYYLSFTTSPPRLAGGAVLIHETMNQVKEARRAWGYNAGQRRVRRAPNLAYDSPIAAADNLRTADDTDLFNGALDRYDWNYQGVKEVYIPYNNYRIAQAGVPYSEILGVSHINPDLVRWELHRVHIVDAILKDSSRHIYQKRRFYIDEDSWNIALMDQYDARGELWRVSMAMLKNFYELPGVWTALDVFYDLQARRYHVQGLDTEEPSTRQFADKNPGSRYFSPFALRRRGVR